FFASHRSAASGSTTMTSRYVEMTPTDTAVLARPPAWILRGAAAADAVAALMGRASDRALDRDHAARVQVEPDPVRLEPAAEELVADVEGRAGVVLLAPAREVWALQHRFHDRPIAARREDPLLLRRMRVLDERLGRRRRIRRRHHR